MKSGVLFLVTSVFSVIAWAQSPMAMQASQVLEKISSAGYQNIDQLELKHGVYKAEALDSNQQEVDIRISADTGQFLPTEVNVPKRDMLSVAQKLEKQGNAVREIKLAASGQYYTVELTNAQGEKQKLRVDANEKVKPVSAS
ncbi:MAG: hypothetical protein COV52_06380 [Gammaproteobacteria bacterium CG11_big_fil_rev_8_21_14_0_20_46_22]|nr:MAG: hypothetical protein COW05_07280 [Gammaproteobacteria bacterium CG12_big_fil_rev_8_21_14_0_65_46_12]PIR11127.1 MAG: hypothetical protein COV52_06380 [Gammaproteobacteria bacterium CG11_big_fil_rev_8_21_14_0_20_46_22]